MGEHGSRERQLREARRRRSGGPLPAPPAPAVPRVGTPVPAPVDPEPAYAVAVAAHDRTRRPFGDEQPPVPAAPAGSAAALLPVVIAAAPVVAARIPPGPAAVLGRIGAPVLPGDTGLPVPPPEQVAAGLAERLLGALELAVPELPVAAPSALVDLLRADIPDGTGFAVVDWAHEPESVTAGRRVDQFAPRTRDLVAGLVAALVDDVALAPLSAAPEGAGDPEAVEAGLAAARGRGVLAVAVVTALAVLRATAHPMVGDGAPAVVGVALDAAARLLPGRPPHPAHLGAATALRRARFLLPRHAGGSVPVDGHRFALVDGPFPVDLPSRRTAWWRPYPAGWWCAPVCSPVGCRSGCWCWRIRPVIPTRGCGTRSSN
jgi:hypothetical protein